MSTVVSLSRGGCQPPAVKPPASRLNVPFWLLTFAALCGGSRRSPLHLEGLGISQPQGAASATAAAAAPRGAVLQRAVARRRKSYRESRWRPSPSRTGIAKYSVGARDRWAALGVGTRRAARPRVGGVSVASGKAGRSTRCSLGGTEGTLRGAAEYRQQHQPVRCWRAGRRRRGGAQGARRRRRRRRRGGRRI